MLRGENIVCGTSTTGTGTLTLAATPVAPGGIDFDVLARATGIGFGNSAAVLVSYTLIEYTDATFATAKSTEKGVGTLTLGGSAGIANCTLARTTPQVTATSLNSQPATYNTNAPTAVSIGTAANVLVFIGASAADIPAYEPYFETSLGDALGVSPANAISAYGVTPSLVSGTDEYILFEWRTPMLVKRCTVNVTTNYNGGTPVSNADARLYAIGSNGRPGKLLYDFGLFGAAGTSLNATGLVSTGAAGSGFFLQPGEYYLDFLTVFSGGVTPPALRAAATGCYTTSTRFGSTITSGSPTTGGATATGGAIGAAPDPANVTGYALSFSTINRLMFLLNSS